MIRSRRNKFAKRSLNPIALFVFSYEFVAKYYTFFLSSPASFAAVVIESHRRDGLNSFNRGPH